MSPPAGARLVLDTNVVISALLSACRAPAILLDLTLAGEITLLADDRILAEYRAVAHRPKFALETTQLSRVFAALESMTERIVPHPLAIELPDPDDLPFLEVAIAGHADALVTGDARHFRSGRTVHPVPILTPREMLDRLRR